MAWWKSPHRQRGRVKAHEAKAIGKYTRRAEDAREIADALTQEAEDLGLYVSEEPVGPVVRVERITREEAIRRYGLPGPLILTLPYW